MSDANETLSDFEEKTTNIVENIADDVDEGLSTLEEHMASQAPRPKLVLVNTKRKTKAKPSNPPSSPTSPSTSSEPLSPGESILAVEVSPGLTKPNGWGSYYMGDARKPDLNSHPAALGMPTTRTGFYNITTGTSSVTCPMCFQKFTTITVFETGHLDPGGPCEKFRVRVEASQNTPGKGKGKAIGKGKEVDEVRHGVQLGSDHEVKSGDHHMEGGVEQRFDTGMANQMTGGPQLIQGGDSNQVRHGEETTLGAPMDNIFQGFGNGELARRYLGPDLGAGPLHIGEADRTFELPAGYDRSGELPGMGQFWTYQGFDGLPGFDENWEYYGPEDGAGFRGLE